MMRGSQFWLYNPQRGNPYKDDGHWAGHPQPKYSWKANTILDAKEMEGRKVCLIIYIYEKWKIAKYCSPWYQQDRYSYDAKKYKNSPRWLLGIDCLVVWWHNYWSLDFNIDEDKNPVGNGEGGVDDGDEEEADVLDLLLRLTLPHALHQLGYLKQYMLSCLNGPFELLTVHSQMTKKMGRTQKKAQTSK